MTGVTYTGNYQTVDDYNPYKYTSQAPFGAENVRSYRYRGLIRDPNRKKSTRRDYSGVRRKAIKEMLGFGADYTESGNVAADVMVGYEWTIYDMDDDEVDNDELIALIDSAVQDHIIYEYENERDPSSQGITYVNYVNEDEKVEELSVYYRYDVNVELGAESPADGSPRPKKDIEICPDFRKNMDNCYLKSCKVCAKEGRTPEALQKLRQTGWFRKDGTQKGITDHDFGIQAHSRRPQQLPRGDDYNLGEYDSEGYEPEPLNMQGAVGVLMAIAGVLILKL